MLHFNVIHKRKGESGAQYFTGSDRGLTERTALNASSHLRKGDKVTVWSMDDKTGLQQVVQGWRWPRKASFAEASGAQQDHDKALGATTVVTCKNKIEGNPNIR